MDLMHAAAVFQKITQRAIATFILTIRILKVLYALNVTIKTSK